MSVEQTLVAAGLVPSADMQAIRQSLEERGMEPTDENILKTATEWGLVNEEQIAAIKEKPGGAPPEEAATDRKEPPVPYDPMIGQVIGGRYKIEERIGVGGFGRVYKATGAAGHGEAALEFAVKLLHDRFCDDPQAVEEFFGEVNNVSVMAHPGVVTVVDTGWHDRRPYIAMEYVRGKALKQVLKERGGRLDVATGLRIVAQVADVIASAHDVGLIHRDIKPANIMVIGECEPTTVQVKVLDFGIAKLEAEMSEGHLTVAGTAGYQAPEQAEGRPSLASDVWALGVVLYQVLNGRLPNQAPPDWPSDRKREYLARGDPSPLSGWTLRKPFRRTLKRS